MVIVADFGSDVQRYQEDFFQLTIPKPQVCPHCAATDRLVGHGSYSRHLWDQAQTYLIRVKRLFCPSCRHTVSLLPSFCLPHRRYLTATIQRILSLRLEAKASWQTLRHRLSSDLPALTTCREWTSAFVKASQPYLERLSQQLAFWQLSPGKLELALADIAAVPKGPKQLLAAFPHLLAWLSDQRLADPEDGGCWLAKLWQWGQGVRLGRLV